MKEDPELLAEALGDLHKGETVERAIGRILRRHGGKYEDYVRIVGDVREAALKAKITPLEAARKLAQV